MVFELRTVLSLTGGKVEKEEECERQQMSLPTAFVTAVAAVMRSTEHTLCGDLDPDECKPKTRRVRLLSAVRRACGSSGRAMAVLSLVADMHGPE